MPFSQSPKYPGAVATDADLLNWHNVTPSATLPTLLAAIDSLVTSFSLNAGGGSTLPAASFTISIDDEIIFVGARSTDSLTGCVRAYEGSSAAAHSINAIVSPRVTAMSHNQVVAEVNAIEMTLGANLQHVYGLVTVPFSATPTFEVQSGVNFLMTLTGNVTSSLFLDAVAGQTYKFIIKQDATGGRSFVWPTNIVGGMTINASAVANKVYVQSFIFDGTTAYALGVGTIN